MGDESSTFFTAGGDAYENFMGRYSRPLAPLLADLAGVVPGLVALDVGCGTGVLTSELVRRLGAEHVAGTDPSPMLQTARSRLSAVDLRAGYAEALPFGDDSFDVTLAQLVLHFVDDPEQAVAEMRRVTLPGGRVATCVWDDGGGMSMISAFVDALEDMEVAFPDRLRRWPLGRAGEQSALLEEAGLTSVREEMLTVRTRYESLDELWDILLGGAGPVGAHVLTLSEEERQLVHDAYRRRLGSPTGTFPLEAVAHAAVGTVPS
ncbi:class I SAM-dependent methyltransferase [Ornithinimicrobium tianjinense]|uniref:SAM-dependent methyltransferase n=1 Tax=Ornithinimicrobium tianjinense TaxID=1195761 RepID=A0A917BJN6_9MICO|nr:methyltransferase domain-containing protein [Ornithinimicrobium tianjinense]GGF43996.1 SAM-dependent methyltransferase [Ornithinimicrobium tianjinense]